MSDLHSIAVDNCDNIDYSDLFVSPLKEKSEFSTRPPEKTNIEIVSRPVNLNNPATWLRPDQKLIGCGFDWSWCYIIFSDIEDHDGCKVDSEGKLWSCWCKKGNGRYNGSIRIKTCEWKIVNSVIGRRGYLVARITDSSNKRRFWPVHLIVLKAFFGNRENMIGRHLNGDGWDNTLRNLMWGDNLQNMADRDRHGTTYRGSKHFRSKLTEDQVLEIIDMYNSGKMQSEIARHFGMTDCAINQIVKGKSWGWLTKDLIKKRA